MILFLNFEVELQFVKARTIGMDVIPTMLCPVTKMKWLAVLVLLHLVVEKDSSLIQTVFLITILGLLLGVHQ